MGGCSSRHEAADVLDESKPRSFPEYAETKTTEATQNVKEILPGDVSKDELTHDDISEEVSSTSPGTSPRHEKKPGVESTVEVDGDPRLVAERRVSLTRVKKGYSSGGSSVETLEEGEDSQKTLESYLSSWRSELAADGDLSKRVVRIETAFGRSIEEVYDGVHDGPILGTGIEGIVRKVKHRSTGILYAAKCLDISLINSERALRQLREEIFIMCQLDHPNIVRLEEVYESHSDIYLIQELCNGGDLFDRLDEQPDFHYSEPQCARLVKQMLSAVRYLHSKNIVHRDLKLENFLFSSNNPESIELRLIDFGLSKHFAESGEIHDECVGTPYSVAPEVILGQYDEKCDVWALGVITYLLLCGESPFGGEDGERLMDVRDRILSGEVFFEPSIWDHVSSLGKQFVLRLLNTDPAMRPTARQLQSDPWIQVFSKKNALESKRLSSQTVRALVEFKTFSDLRKLLCEILSFTLLPDQIVNLRDEFSAIDADGDGEISVAEFRTVLSENALSGNLGSLTEKEVAAIFDAICIGHAEQTIRWHEFLAAGLAQCKVDDRNLRLAFGRLDYDNDGIVSLDDLIGLLGSDDRKDELTKIWRDGIDEHQLPLERLTYEDFLLIMKGQRKESTTGTPDIPRSSRHLESPSLESVPEGSVSPQPKRANFAVVKHDGGGQGYQVRSHPVADIPFPAEVGLPSLLPLRRRARSRSFEVPRVTVWNDDDSHEEDHLEGMETPCRRLHRISPLSDPSYRIRKDMRQAVLEASKQFERKQQFRKHKMIDDLQGPPPSKAGLTMRRGSIPLVGEASLHVQNSAPQTLTSSSQDVLEASKKGGRPARRKRVKTLSDMTGMMKAG